MTVVDATISADFTLKELSKALQSVKSGNLDEGQRMDFIIPQ
jgi:hypothetical protein